jgi:hypothetical protein
MLCEYFIDLLPTTLILWWTISCGLSIMRIYSPLLVSSATARRLTAITAIAIPVILLISNVTIINAQQQEDGQSGEIENATAATPFQSTDDGFRLEVPEGWLIHDVSDTGSELGVEASEGFEILAQLCPEEEQQVLPNASASGGSTTTSSCQGAQEELIHIIRYPDLEAAIQEDNNVTTYHLQKLQEVGYRSMQIATTEDMTVNLANAQTSEIIAPLPAKFVEMTYSTTSAPDEIRTGYFILTGTAATEPDVGTAKGYSIFYEGDSLSAAETTTTASDSLPSPLPQAVEQIFDSFELIAAEEVAAQAIAQQETQTVVTTQSVDGGVSDDTNDDNAGANSDNAGAGAPVADEESSDEEIEQGSEDDNAGNAGANSDNAGANSDNAGAGAPVADEESSDEEIEQGSEDDNGDDGEGGPGIAESVTDDTEGMAESVTDDTEGMAESVT